MHLIKVTVPASGSIKTRDLLIRRTVLNRNQGEWKYAIKVQARLPSAGTRNKLN